MDQKTLQIKTKFLVLLAAIAMLPGITLAQETTDNGFVVKDMRVEGLQRISEGTVFNYLPINSGDKLDSFRSGAANRSFSGTIHFCLTYIMSGD